MDNNGLEMNEESSSSITFYEVRDETEQQVKRRRVDDQGSQCENVTTGGGLDHPFGNLIVLQNRISETNPQPQQSSTNVSVVECVVISTEKDCPCLCTCPTKGQLSFPLSSDQFDDFESKLDREEIKELMIKRIMLIGGKCDNYECHLREALKFCLTEECRKKFNWAGKGKKKKFQDTNLQQTIFEAIQDKNKLDYEKCSSKSFSVETSEVTDHKLIPYCQHWLKVTKIRKNKDDFRHKSIFPSGCKCKCTCEKQGQFASELPPQSVKDLLVLDEDIQRNEGIYLRLRDKLVNVDLKGKKKNEGSQARKAMTMIMPHHVRLEFNWEGHGKRAFNKLHIANAVFDSVRLIHPTATDYDIKNYIQKWLKSSKRCSEGSGPAAPDQEDLNDMA